VRKPTATELAITSMIGALVLLYWPVLTDLVRNWARDENYSHGFLILPATAFLVWQRRARLAAAEPRPTNLGLLLVVVSLVTLLVGTTGVEFFLMRTSAFGVAAGLVLFLAGWQWLKILRFPLAFSLLMIPLPAIVFYQITFPLQLLATRFGVWVLGLAKIPALREGNVIVLAHTTLEVVDACSGIRSLMSLFALAALYGYFATPRTGPRILIMLSSIPIAIVANGLRVAGTGIAAQYVGPDAATGFLHTFSGSVVFVTSFFLLIAVASALTARDSSRIVRVEGAAC
jgi:exosortase